MESKIQKIFRTTSTGRVYHIGALWVQITAPKSIPYHTVTAYTFPESFQTACFAAIPICVQLGFGARATISISGWTKTGCNVSQDNGPDVGMNVSVIAIGY